MSNAACRTGIGVRISHLNRSPRATDPTRLTDFVTPTNGAIVAVTAAIAVHR
jgi:hypothetical protein